MNQTQQLKLLNDQIKCLFSQGISENEAFAQLNDDPRFDSVRRSSVQSLYKKLQKDADKKAKNEAAKERLKQWKQCQQYKRNAKNLLLYESQLISTEDTRFDSVLEGRYALIRNKRGFMRKLEVYDLYQDISKEISIPSDVPFYRTRNLSLNFVLIYEIAFPETFVHLAYINLIEGSLELIQKIEHGNYTFWNAFVDSSNSSKFAVKWFSDNGASIVTYSLSSNGTINVGEKTVFENRDQTDDIEAYFGNQMFGLKFENGHRRNMDYASIVVQDLVGEKKSKTSKLDSLPSNIRAQSDSCYWQWFRDHLFVDIQFCLTGLHGVAFTDPQTRKWTIMEFAIDLTIERLNFVGNGDLLISAGKHRYENNIHKSEISKVYKIPVYKPESLEVKAWIKSIEWFKNQGVDDAYKEARRYLPLISKIQSPLNVSERLNKV